MVDDGSWKSHERTERESLYERDKESSSDHKRKEERLLEDKFAA